MTTWKITESKPHRYKVVRVEGDRTMTYGTMDGNIYGVLINIAQHLDSGDLVEVPHHGAVGGGRSKLSFFLPTLYTVLTKNSSGWHN